MSVTQSYKISSETFSVALVAMTHYRDAVKLSIECGSDQYWLERLASVDAAIRELRAAELAAA